MYKLQFAEPPSSPKGFTTNLSPKRILICVAAYLVQLNTNKVTNNVGRTVSLPGCTRSLTDRTTTSAKCVLICVELYLACGLLSWSLVGAGVGRVRNARGRRRGRIRFRSVRLFGA